MKIETHFCVAIFNSGGGYGENSSPNRDELASEEAVPRIASRRRGNAFGKLPEGNSRISPPPHVLLFKLQKKCFILNIESYYNYEILITMKLFSKYSIVFLCLFAFFVVPFLCSAVQTPEKIFYMSQLREKEGIKSLEKNADKIDILAPQFYAVSTRLKFVGGLGTQLKEIIGQKKIKVMPLIANTGFRQDVMHNLLLSEKAQNEIINSLIAEAKKEKYIGWQFDFENINYLDKDLYSAFVEKTAQSLHKNGLILSVAAVSRSVDYEDTDFFKNWGGAFDYARIAKAVDFISLMTYDDPNSVGPVASLPFINKVLNYVKDNIPPEKLSLGIPLYYWGWNADSSKKVTTSGTYSRLLGIKSNFRYNFGFDEALGASWLTYFWQNNQYKIWYQDKQSFKNKLDIVNNNNFRGFSSWVLGVEDPDIWNVLTGSTKQN